ncbi:MAG: endonuclease/exonuclease/phosphatase family protein [Planctomycetes bacterium]|nr:endonuclease/exonuclease/phosphatase family protein [Planctomycetota bacterium]
MLAPFARAAAAALCLCLSASASETLRVVTWNVLGLQPASSSYDALVDTLLRVDGDVVLLQEITGAGDVAAVPGLAADTGYAYSFVGNTSGTLSGGLRTAILSRHPILASESWTAAELSGDPLANDISRDIIEVLISLPEACAPLALFTVHFKSGSSNTDKFRRQVEQQRLKRAIDLRQAATPGVQVLVGGDFNEDIDNAPFTDVWSALPSGLPGSYKLGTDITFPVTYAPFGVLAGEGLAYVDATQEDSTTVYSTISGSGNRLDYIWAPTGMVVLGDEVYDSADDDGLDAAPAGNILRKAGAPLPAGTSATASDHWPAFADVLLESCDGTRFGSGSPATFALVPRAGIASEPALGTPDFRLRLLYATPGASAILVLGVAKLAPPSGFPLDPFVPGATLFVDFSTAVGLFPAVVDANGQAEFTLPVPNKPSLVGFELETQWFVSDPGAPNGVGAMTDGYQAVIGN